MNRSDLNRHMHRQHKAFEKRYAEAASFEAKVLVHENAHAEGADHEHPDEDYDPSKDEKTSRADKKRRRIFNLHLHHQHGTPGDEATHAALHEPGTLTDPDHTHVWPLDLVALEEMTREAIEENRLMYEQRTDRVNMIRGTE